MTPEAQDSIDQLVKREAEFRERKKIKAAAAAEAEKNKGYWEKFKDSFTSTPAVKPQDGRDPLNRNMNKAEQFVKGFNKQ